MCLLLLHHMLKLSCSNFQLKFWRSVSGVLQSCSSIEPSRTWMGDRLDPRSKSGLQLGKIFFAFFQISLHFRLFHIISSILTLQLMILYDFLSIYHEFEVSKNTKNEFSQKGLGENSYYQCHLIDSWGYYIGVVVIPQVHFKFTQTHFRLTVGEKIHNFRSLRFFVLIFGVIN